MSTYPKYKPTQSTPARSGAQDALKVPSLANGIRIPYQKPKAICVGLNKAVPGGFEK